MKVTHLFVTFVVVVLQVAVQDAVAVSDMYSTGAPTTSPTSAPTISPTKSPTVSPTNSPTITPTNSPTITPTNSPTNSPTVSPSDTPTVSPTNSPTISPTVSPTNSPTVFPTASPTISPTSTPTVSPTKYPTNSPTQSPTFAPIHHCDEPDRFMNSDPQPQRVAATPPQAYARFGKAVSASETQVVVGEPERDVDGDNKVGAVTVFIKNDRDVWIGIPVPNEFAYEESFFGAAVAITKSSTYMVIGAPGYPQALMYSQYAPGLYHVETDLEFQGEEDEYYPEIGTEFGAAVAIVEISPGRVVVAVGAPDAPGGGAVYIFSSTDSDEGNPEYTQLILPPNGEESGKFGSSLALSAGYLVVGQPYDDTDGTDSGSIFVYPATGEDPEGYGRIVYNIDEVQQLSADDNTYATNNEFLFGSAVDIDEVGLVIIAGAPHMNYNRADSTRGKAFVFERESGTATFPTLPTQEINPPDDFNVYSHEYFGSTVSISEDTLGVGSSDGRGFAFIYNKNQDGIWRQIDEPLESEPRYSWDRFGYQISICGPLMVAGSLWDETTSATNAGTAYIFEKHPVLDCVPTDSPTRSPTTAPTRAPTDAPTTSPTLAPTLSPTDSPVPFQNELTDAPTQSPTARDNKVDLYFVMDKSASIRRYKYQCRGIEIDGVTGDNCWALFALFIKRIVSLLVADGISFGDLRVEVNGFACKYSQKKPVHVQYTSLTGDEATYDTAMANMQADSIPTYAGTCPGQAMESVLARIERVMQSDATVDRERHHIVIVVTDGETYDFDRPYDAAMAMHKRGVTVFGIGIFPRYLTPLRLSALEDHREQIARFTNNRRYAWQIGSFAVEAVGMDIVEKIKTDPLPITPYPYEDHFNQHCHYGLINDKLTTTQFNYMTRTQGAFYLPRDNSNLFREVCEAHSDVCDWNEFRLECRHKFTPTAAPTTTAQGEVQTIDEICRSIPYGTAGRTQCRNTDGCQSYYCRGCVFGTRYRCRAAPTAAPTASPQPARFDCSGFTTKQTCEANDILCTWFTGSSSVIKCRPTALN